MRPEIEEKGPAPALIEYNFNGLTMGVGAGLKIMCGTSSQLVSALSSDWT